MPGDPRAVLMCPPAHFDVIDVKNVFMEGRQGTVDHAAARSQWDALRLAFESSGLHVELVAATPGCEDMVFAANQTLPGVTTDGRRVCVLSHMNHASRRREVAAYAEWFAAHGFAVVDPLPPACRFEGCGDAIWHPGRHRLWIGYGERSDAEAHAAVAAVFDAEVRSLHLADRRFYHLDTCFCALDAHRALVYPGAFDAPSMALLRAGFDELLEVEEREAVETFACNATALPTGHVLIEQRAAHTIARLDSLGYRTVPLDTGEFLKSGGSVFCMKQFVP
ncbi:MAG: amidinotransferase [Planctomycetes bacterium]|nr:amidinotransferase [Planctomycetota bacterium]